MGPLEKRWAKGGPGFPLFIRFDNKLENNYKFKNQIKNPYDSLDAKEQPSLPEFGSRIQEMSRRDLPNSWRTMPDALLPGIKQPMVSHIEADYYLKSAPQSLLLIFIIFVYLSSGQ